MIRRPPRSTPLYSSAASDVYKRQVLRYGTASLMARREHLHDAGIAGDDSGLVAQDVELARGVPREAEDRDARIHHEIADTVGHVGRGAHVEEATLGLAEDARVVAEDILPGECRHPRSPVDEAADDRLTLLDRPVWGRVVVLRDRVDQTRSRST